MVLGLGFRVRSIGLPLFRVYKVHVAFFLFCITGFGCRASRGWVSLGFRVHVGLASLAFPGGGCLGFKVHVGLASLAFQGVGV